MPLPAGQGRTTAAAAAATSTIRSLPIRNRTFCEGDNLEFLLRIPDASVDLIVTDPPFKKDRKFQGIGEAEGASFKDYWSWDDDDDVHPAYLAHVRQHWSALGEVIEAAYAAHSPSMAAFLAFMSVRLIEMHRILKETGSIYLHCDHDANSYLRAMLDAIFTKDNFRNQLTWRRATSHNDADRFGNITDSILYYVRSASATWNGDAITEPKTDEQLQEDYPSVDSRGRYRSDNLTGPRHNAERGSPSTQAWHGYDVFGMNRVWSAPKTGAYAHYIEEHFIPGYTAIEGVHARLDALDKAGLITHPKKGKWPGLKRYAAADQGTPPQNIILKPTGFTNYSKGPEYRGYPTQKPVALYSRLIRASSNENDMVLDPFAGCATTCVAAEQLGRQWIGIDLSPQAHGITMDRLEKECGRGSFWEKNVRLLTTAELRPLKNGVSAALAIPQLPARVQRGIPRGYKPENVRRYLAGRDAEGMRRTDAGNIACQGCGYTPPRLDYQDVDHITPRAKEGANAWSNFCLLCSPCNRRKAHKLTIDELRTEIRAEGLMLDESKLVPMDAVSIAKRDRAFRPLQ